MSLDWAWGYPEDETTLEWRRAMRFHRVPREKEERKATKRGAKDAAGEGKPRGRKRRRRRKEEGDEEEKGRGEKKRRKGCRSTRRDNKMECRAELSPSEAARG